MTLLLSIPEGADILSEYAGQDSKFTLWTQPKTVCSYKVNTFFPNLYNKLWKLTHIIDNSLTFCQSMFQYASGSPSKTSSMSWSLHPSTS